MNAVETATVIGSSVKIHGELAGSEDLMLDGEVEGTIRLTGARLTIGPKARCRADIIAQEVVIFGRLDGDIHAKGRVELRASALVRGNIFAGTLAIEENAMFRGKVDPTGAADEPWITVADGDLVATAAPFIGTHSSVKKSKLQEPAPLLAVTEA